MKKKDKIENSLKIYPVPKEAKHGRKPNQRMKPYLIYQFLLRNSNENKTITADNIAAYLSADCGVDAERHSVYKDIDAMKTMQRLKRQKRPLIMILIMKKKR